MSHLKAILFVVFTIIPAFVFATTWDEPWANEIIKKADHFVFAKIKSSDEKKVTIEIIKTLGGEEITGKIDITDFYLLDLCSGSGEGPEFHFSNIKESYFFLKKNDKKEYCIATPTTGFDCIREGKVYATYRHSYHQAMVPIDNYEKTMTAIFNYYHNQSYDTQFINAYVNQYLSLKPAGFGETEIDTFFAQHVALECVYHLRLAGFYSKIIPFLEDESNFHNQVSAARALIASNTPECKQELLKVIRDSKRDQFVRVICVWTLGEFKPTEHKDDLVKISKKAPTDDIGFGGNLMDPRICTHFPSLKAAIDKLIETL